MPYTSINVPIIPTTFSFSVFVMLDGIPAEQGEFKLNIFYKDEPEKILNNIIVPIAFSAIEQAKDNKAANISFVVNVRNMFFEKEGTYIIDLFYNADKLSTQTVGLYKVESEGK